MSKLGFAVAVLAFLVATAAHARSISVTVQVNWDDGTPFAGRFVLNGQNDSYGYTLDDTGWASVQQIDVDPARKYELILFDDRDNVILHAYSIPVPPAEASAVLWLLSNKQITVTISAIDNSIEDVHLENQ